MKKRTMSIALMLLGLAAGSPAARQPGSPAAGQDRPAQPGLNVDANRIGSACLSPADLQRSPSEFSPDQIRQIMACLTTEAARQLNAQLPRQIDEVTRLDRVTTSGAELTYHYSVSTRMAELPDGVVARLESETRAHVCAEPSMVSTMQMGGVYGYRWIDSDGKVIHQLRITGC